MLVAYVSDERYVALPDVLLEFEGEAGSFEARSRATGSVHVDLPPGTYKVTLQKPGFGAKSVRVRDRTGPRALSVPAAVRRPARLRLAQVGQGRREVRVPRPLRRALSSESLAVRISQGARPRASAGSTSTARGPRCRSRPTATTPRPASPGTSTAMPTRCCTSMSTAPERSGLYYFHADGQSGAEFAFPWIVAPAQPHAPSPCWPRTSPGTPTTTSAAAATTSTPTACRRRPRSTPGSSSSATPTRTTSRTTPKTMRRSRSTVPSRSTTSTLSTEITDPIEGRAACHIAPAEWRLLGWLEREHFAYDYYAETQLHDGTLDLDAYKVLDPLDASGILVADDVLRGQVVGSRARRQARCTWAATA